MVGWKVANELIRSKWKWKDSRNLPSVKKPQWESVRFLQTKETAVFRPADSASTINTASGAFLISSTVTNPYKTSGDQFEVCSRMDQSIQTYITFRSFEVSLDHNETWVEIVDKLNYALEYLTDHNHKLIVYPYPKNFITPSTGLKTYSRLNLKNRQNKTKWVNKYDLEPYVDRIPGLNIDKLLYIKQLIGHEKSFEAILTDATIKSIKSHCCNLFKASVQAAAKMICATRHACFGSQRSKNLSMVQ